MSKPIAPNFGDERFCAIYRRFTDEGLKPTDAVIRAQIEAAARNRVYKCNFPVRTKPRGGFEFL